MSITTTEQDEPPIADSHKIPSEQRRTNFTRSPSIDKIIKFNTYICYQSFFILPSILTWLKTSQTVLVTYAERCTITIKSTIYSATLYRVAEAQLGVVKTAFKDVSIREPKRILPALRVILIGFGENVGNLPERFKRKILKIVVYFSFLYIFLQLLFCFWTLSGALVPLGLIFLLGCLTVISFANFQCLRFIIIQEILKGEMRSCRTTHVSRSYVRARDIMGRRTISNINLF